MSLKPAVLITGASTGIGAEYADRFAKRGHDLILVARDAARLKTVAQRLVTHTGVSVQTLPADLSDPAQLATVEERLEKDARVGILVNNAGASAAGGFLEQRSEDFDSMIAVNVTALTRLAGAAARRFANAGTGAIINVGSVVGLAPEIGLTVYGATKAFVLFLSQGLDLELAGQGVYIQAVLPSATRTEIWERSGRSIDDLPAVMETADLVDAALVGFDRREKVTIPPLPDLGQWSAYEAARAAMVPNFMQSSPAARYLVPS